MRISKNDFSKVPTRFNVLSKTKYNCRDRRTLYGRIFGYRHYDKIVIFEFCFWAHMRKSKNDLSKVPTRCNLLSKRNYNCRDRRTLYGRIFGYRHYDKIVIFDFSFWAHMRKSKNDLSKVPTRCNLVPKINLNRRDRSTLSGRNFVYRHKKKHIIVKPIRSSLRSESKIPNIPKIPY